MKGYVIGDIEVTDPAAFAEYGKRVPATIAQYGGRYIVRGGKMQPLEGAWSPKRIVVLEFPSVEHARKWYDSPEYRPLIGMRQKASRGSLLIVEGYVPPS
ncbi:MAG: DUF1330 domain-containing protein [Betaproteobacteria bacterium]|nr:DUF1330 domain-containing protein [Betaproteobacteria bacterium]